MSFILPVGEKNVEYTSFQGSPYFNVIVMYFLSHKHANTCVILSEPYKKDKTKNIHWFPDAAKHVHNENCVLLPTKISLIPDEQTEVSLRFIENENGKSYISVPEPQEAFWNKFTKCFPVKEKRFIVLPFGFTCVDSGHANYLIYDRKTKCLERFEPFGYVNDPHCLNPKNLDKMIKELFEKNLGKKFIKKYHKPLHYLPENNFQTIQENEKEMTKSDPVGFCSVWSAWYIDLRLSNPDIDRKTLVKNALHELKKIKKEEGISFTKFIRNYSMLLVNVSEAIKEMY